MAKSSAISYPTNKNTLIGALCVGVIFVTTRTGLRWMSSRRFSWGEDGFCWLALVCQICVTALYLSVLEDIYFVNDETARLLQEAMAGRVPLMHPDMKGHADSMLRAIWPLQYFFWGCLWSVKLSLLFMFKRLTERVPFHAKLWWGVLAFTILAFIGCVISQLTSCHDINLFTTMGGCSDPGDVRLQAISLYYSLAVDVLTDMMIMAIPLSLIWNLQISFYEKLGVGLAFSAGVATIIVAFLRAFMLDKSGKDQNNGTLVDITWLCFWAAIECCIAVCVNCLPSFAILVRTKVREHRSNGGTYPSGYGQMDSKAGHTGMKSGVSRSNIRMGTLGDRYSEEDAERNVEANGYRTRPDPGKYMASVSVGERRQRGVGNHENSSQESIIGPEQKTQEVYVTRTVDIS